MGEMSNDYHYTKVLEEKKEVLEGKSTHSCCIATRLVRQEEEEGMSIGYDHSTAQSARQEEEEVPLDVNERDLVFHRHTLPCAVMLSPLWVTYLHPSFFSIFTWRHYVSLYSVNPLF